MRFSENGYYIERYVKCANCGLLVYGEGIAERSRHGKLRLLLGLVRRVGGAARLGQGLLPAADRAAELPVEDALR